MFGFLSITNSSKYQINMPGTNFLTCVPGFVGVQIIDRHPTLRPFVHSISNNI